jgi:hypothetical protein
MATACSEGLSVPAAHAQGCEACEEERVCWICLAGEEAGPLDRPCPCPRWCHRACIAHWQLVSAGKE